MPFKKAVSKQLALKMLAYGPTKSGKTFTSLLIAELLAARVGKRVAFVNTEAESGGVDFYTKEVPGRAAHPKAFDFDSIETRSIAKAIKEIRSLDTDVYGVLIVDSLTHFWRSAMDAYGSDKIPFHAWTKIKGTFKELIDLLISSPVHVICCARQKDQYDTTDGEFEFIGVGPDLEKGTAYEFPIVVRMSAELRQKTNRKVHTMYVEGDRTGVLDGRQFTKPGFDTVAPLLPLLDNEQREREDEARRLEQDAEQLEAKANAKIAKSKTLKEDYTKRLLEVSSPAELDRLKHEISKKTRTMTEGDRADLIAVYDSKLRDLGGLQS